MFKGLDIFLTMSLCITLFGDLVCTSSSGLLVLNDMALPSTSNLVLRDWNRMRLPAVMNVKRLLKLGKWTNEILTVMYRSSFGALLEAAL